METKNNEIIVSTVTAPSKFTFKNAKLNELSVKIAEQTAAINALYNDAKDKAERINQQLAPIFGEMLTTKCYKDDGFKSVADFAEQTFGMGKSMAYMLARVGKEFYGENAEAMKDVRAKLSNPAPLPIRPHSSNAASMPQATRRRAPASPKCSPRLPS